MIIASPTGIEQSKNQHFGLVWFSVFGKKSAQAHVCLYVVSDDNI
jgi:hypothetical protein